MRVLIVEDDEIIRFILSHHFNSAGFEVTLAEDGQHGLDLLIETNFDTDLIITDLMMPRLDGYELARKVRIGHRRFELPIIAITAGIISDEEKNRTLFNYTLQKPMDIKGLVSLSKCLIAESEKLQDHPVAM
ncbi:response regulator [Belliella pelovolcani]|uniref:response regulator n=1 Tax=Belliella pelovolcani TaxID=529505 RepID=UPI00391A1BEE